MPPPDRVFDVQTSVSETPRRPDPVEFIHCGAVHYVTTRPVPRDQPLPPDAVAMVCGACPVPRLGLELLCHQCGQPLEAREAGGRLLWPVRG